MRDISRRARSSPLVSAETTAAPGRTRSTEACRCSTQEQTPTLTATASLDGQSNEMYAYDRIRRTVPPRAQYSAAASGKSDTLAGVRELCGWPRQQPNTLFDLRFSFSLSTEDRDFRNPETRYRGALLHDGVPGVRWIPVVYNAQGCITREPPGIGGHRIARRRRGVCSIRLRLCAETRGDAHREPKQRGRWMFPPPS
jgi:hypothetical protein